MRDAASRAARRGSLLAALLVAPAAAWAGSPQLDYQLHCQGCHLPGGTGKPGAVPSLVDSVGLFLRVPGGREFLVQVPGSAWSALDDASLAALLNWMIRRFGPAEVASDFRPYEADEVRRLRREPLAEVASRRRALVAQLAERSPAP